MKAEYQKYFKDNFEYLAFRERAALKNFETLYRAFPDENYTKYVTQYYSNDRYDCLYSRHQNGTINKRLYIEIKVRDDIHPNYYMEPRKFNDITGIAQKLLTEDEYDIIYINFTPEGTFIWNVSKLKREGKLEKEKKMANKRTAESRTDKELKDFYILEKDMAKFYGYIWEEKQIDLHIQNYFVSKFEQQKIKKSGFTI